MISIDVCPDSDAFAIVLIKKLNPEHPSTMTCTVLLGARNLPVGLFGNLRDHEVIETNTMLEVPLSLS